MNNKHRLNVLRFTAIIIITAVAAAAVVLISFYLKMPSAARIVATTGSLSFTTPSQEAVSSRLVWPIRAGDICTENESDNFSVEEPKENWNCDNNRGMTGTLWFSPNVIVSIYSRQSNIEIFVDGQVDYTKKQKIFFRNADGSLKTFTLPAKIKIKDKTTSNIVLPIVSRKVLVGRSTYWQELSNLPILQAGTVTLVRESFFGNKLFSPEQIDLMVGDLVEIEGAQPDFIQGVVQLGHKTFYKVGITVHNGGAVLKRYSRNSVLMDASVANYLLNDPTLIIFWAFITLVGSSVIGFLKSRLSHK